jgi:hypothetical protein
LKLTIRNEPDSVPLEEISPMVFTLNSPGGAESEMVRANAAFVAIKKATRRMVYRNAKIDP